MPRLYPHCEGRRIGISNTHSQRIVAKNMTTVIMQNGLSPNYEIDTFNDIFIECDFHQIKVIATTLRLLGQDYSFS